MKAEGSTMADVVRMPRPDDATYCSCLEPDPLLLSFWEALECRVCRRPVKRAEPLASTDDRTYSLRDVARLFRTSTHKIKERAFAGELPYVVNSKGHFEFPRESLLAHLDELIKRNNRLG